MMSPPPRAITITIPPGHRRAFRRHRHYFTWNIRRDGASGPIAALTGAIFTLLGLGCIVIGFFQLIVALVAVMAVLVWPILTLLLAAFLIKVGLGFSEGRLKFRGWHHEG